MFIFDHYQSPYILFQVNEGSETRNDFRSALKTHSEVVKIGKKAEILKLKDDSKEASWPMTIQILDEKMNLGNLIFQYLFKEFFS